MKTLLTAAFAALSLTLAPAALADGTVGCSNPCVVDEDGTHGDVYGSASGWFGGSFGPFNGDGGVIEDNGKQDMEPFTYDPTYPVEPDGNVIG